MKSCYYVSSVDRRPCAKLPTPYSQDVEISDEAESYSPVDLEADACDLALPHPSWPFWAESR